MIRYHQKGGKRMQYDKEFKLQALQLSDEIGVKKAADQPGINYYTLAEWRKIRKAKGADAFVGSGRSVLPASDKTSVLGQGRAVTLHHACVLSSVSLKGVLKQCSFVQSHLPAYFQK